MSNPSCPSRPISVLAEGSSAAACVRAARLRQHYRHSRLQFAASPGLWCTLHLLLKLRSDIDSQHPCPHARCRRCMQAIYVTMFPCCECAKLLIQAGIREVIFFEDKALPVRPASAPLSGIRRAPGPCTVWQSCCFGHRISHGYMSSAMLPTCCFRIPCKAIETGGKCAHPAEYISYVVIKQRAMHMASMPLSNTKCGAPLHCTSACFVLTFP